MHEFGVTQGRLAQPGILPWPFLQNYGALTTPALRLPLSSVFPDSILIATWPFLPSSSLTKVLQILLPLSDQSSTSPLDCRRSPSYSLHVAIPVLRVELNGLLDRPGFILHGFLLPQEVLVHGPPRRSRWIPGRCVGDPRLDSLFGSSHSSGPQRHQESSVSP